MKTYQVVNRLDGRGFDVVHDDGETYNEGPISTYTEAVGIANDLNGQEEDSAFWASMYRSSPWL